MIARHARSRSRRLDPFTVVFGALAVGEASALAIAFLVGGQDAVGVVSWYACGALAVALLGLVTWPWAELTTPEER